MNPNNQPNQPPQPQGPPQPPAPGQPAYGNYVAPGASQPLPSESPVPQQPYYAAQLPPAPQGQPPAGYPVPQPQQQYPTAPQSPYGQPPVQSSLEKKLPLPMRIVEWLQSRWYVPVGVLFAIAIIGQVVWQVTYPTNAVVPNLVVDGNNFTGVDKDKAIAQLNEVYGEQKVKLFFGEKDVPYQTPKAKELGISVDNSSRMSNVQYPFGLRLVPTSYWWAKSTVKTGAPIYNYNKTTLDTYVLKNFGEECVIPPQNATLKLDDNQFKVVSAVAGGKCNITEFKDAVGKTTYKADGFVVRTGVKEVAAPLTDEIAKQLGDELNNNLSDDMSLQAAGETSTVKSSVVKNWLSFSAFVPEDKNDGKPLPPPRLLYKIEPERVKRYLDTSKISEKVEKKPGVTKISTTDFTETSRVDGTPGRLINITKTIASIDPFINARAAKPTVVVEQVPATESFTRKYTPTEAGYSALIKQFAHDNPGKISIVLKELSGKKPYYNGMTDEGVVHPAAGVEGMYLVYAAQKGIEDGSIQYTDKINGNLSVKDCMKAAAADQDSDCITALLAKISVEKVHAVLREIGMDSTKFTGKITTTTARDMAIFMQTLAENNLKIKNKSDLETGMRELSLRDGMKSSIISGGKVAGGASDKSYNEMAIGSKNGKFVVGFMSEGSDGAKTAAKLIKAIETLRQQKQDLKK